MDYTLAFIAVSIAGAFFLLGPIINKILSDKEKVIDFVFGLACSIALGIVVFDILPEAMDLFAGISSSLMWLLIIVIVAAGFMASKYMDKFIPHHNHDGYSHDHNEEDCHYVHIGLVTSIPLMLHNVLEGMLIYSSTIVDRSLGIVFALSMAIHNIPLGVSIAGTLKKGNASKIKRILIIGALSITTPLGGVIMYLVNNQINDFLLGGLMAFAMGMLIYVAIFELGKEVLKKSDHLISFLGLISGFLLVLISLFI